MKNKIYFILTLAVLIFASCKDDFLQEKNLNQVATGAFYKNSGDAITAVNVCYSALQRQASSQWLCHYFSLRAQESVVTKNAVGADFKGLDNFIIRSDDPAVQKMWGDLYKGVMYCNTAIDRIPGIAIEENLKNRLLGEAYFLRGVYHFQLVCFFGEAIPIINGTPKDSKDLYPGPAAAGVAFKQIIADFETAKKLLPIVDTYKGTADLGRATKGAATGYMGKALLFNKQYAEAAVQFKEIIDQKVGTYALTPNFRDNHDERNENNSESLFEVQYTYLPGVSLWDIDGPGGNESNFIEREGTMVRTGVEQEWWNSRPSDKIGAEFEAGDPRYYQTFWCPGGDLWNHLIPIVGSPGKFTDNWQTYEQYTPSTEQGLIFWRKWCRDYSAEKTAWASDVNIRLMRYSDILLMYAECLIEDPAIGGSPAEYIDKVRDRARADTTTLAYPTGGTIPKVQELIGKGLSFNGVPVNDMRSALRHERMVELMYEFSRWDDIVRWKIGPSVLPSNFKYFLPISQEEINNNPNMEHSNDAYY
jgi:hypothetical protein